MYGQASNKHYSQSYNLIEWSKSTEVLGNIWYHKSLCIEHNACIFDSCAKEAVQVWSCPFIYREAFGVARKQINNTPHRIEYIRTIYAYTR